MERVRILGWTVLLSGMVGNAVVKPSYRAKSSQSLGTVDVLLPYNFQTQLMRSFRRNFPTKEDLKPGVKFKPPAIL